LDNRSTIRQGRDGVAIFLIFIFRLVAIEHQSDAVPPFFRSMRTPYVFKPVQYYTIHMYIVKRSILILDFVSSRWNVMVGLHSLRMLLSCTDCSRTTGPCWMFVWMINRFIDLIWLASVISPAWLMLVAWLVSQVARTASCSNRVELIHCAVTGTKDTYIRLKNFLKGFIFSYFSLFLCAIRKTLYIHCVFKFKHLLTM
jgi:hypothetical protein